MLSPTNVTLIYDYWAKSDQVSTNKRWITRGSVSSHCINWFIKFHSSLELSITFSLFLAWQQPFSGNLFLFMQSKKGNAELMKIQIKTLFNPFCK